MNLLTMSWTATFRGPRPLQPRQTLPSVTMPRTECMPPSLVYFASTGRGLASWWDRFVFWLLAPAPRDHAPPPNRLGLVKREFGALLADVDSEGAEQLRLRITQSHSLRDLWHLRSEAYGLIAVAHSQAEAETRLSLINAHFPTRAPRSQFAPL